MFSLMNFPVEDIEMDERWVCVIFLMALCYLVFNECVLFHDMVPLLSIYQQMV